MLYRHFTVYIVYCVSVWALLPDLNKLDWIGLDLSAIVLFKRQRNSFLLAAYCYCRKKC